MDKHHQIKQLHCNTLGKSKGFTLIELIVAMAILAILVAAAAPTVQSTIRNNSITNEVNRIMTSLQLARSEAVKTNNPVVIERLSGVNSTWNEGWRIFQDNSGEDGGSAFDEDNDIEVYNAGSSSPGISVLANNNAGQFIAFRGNGMNSSNSNLTLYICHRNDASTGRRIRINVSGRAAVDTIPNNENCAPR